MKVLASRRLPGKAFTRLTDVEVVTSLTDIGFRPDVEAVIAANESVALERLPRLRIVANFGVGVNRIDLAACAERGITVTSTPGVLDDATADLAFALLLATRRRVVEGDRLARSGGWTAPARAGLMADEVTGSTLGIIGLGRIGAAVAQRAAGFRMTVLYTQPRPVTTDLATFRTLEQLFDEADVVTVHAPLTEQTRGLVEARLLARLRDGACLINTARGQIVDEKALTAELVSGRLRAGLDVFAHEPHVPGALTNLPNVVLTPHLGSSTRQTREAMTTLVVDNILAVAGGKPPLTPVSA